MQKIGFCDNFSLTQAVLNGTKTMTRRVEKGLENLQEGNFYFNQATCEIYLYGEKGTIIERIKTRYKLGEVVAVAQSYKDARIDPHYLMFATVKEKFSCVEKEIIAMDTKGWSNKMFVRADLMPHQIQITGVRIERLQDITDEDCLKEGVYYDADVDGYKVYNLTLPNKGFKGDCFRQKYFKTPREAFAAIINRPGVGRKGLWESNPFVVVYQFKLVK